MSTFFTILIVIIAILLVLIVVIQNSKGGGLAAGFSSSNQVMGVRKTTDFLEKTTWYLAAGLVVLCILSTISLRSGNKSNGLGIDTESIEQEAPAVEAAPFESPAVEETAPQTETQE